MGSLKAMRCSGEVGCWGLPIDLEFQVLIGQVLGSVNSLELLIFTHTHYTRIGHVIIPKPHCSSCECINSNCRRFDWLIFAVFGQSVRLSITAVVSTQRRVAGHSTVTVAECIVTGRAAGPFNSQTRDGRPSW